MDNKEKKYTEEDIKEAWFKGIHNGFITAARTLGFDIREKEGKVISFNEWLKDKNKKDGYKKSKNNGSEFSRKTD